MATVFSCGNIEVHEAHEWCVGVALADGKPVIFQCPGKAAPRYGIEALRGLTYERVILVVSDGEGEEQDRIDRVTIRFESGRFLTIRADMDDMERPTLGISDLRL